jgi:hypothetical protein
MKQIKFRSRTTESVLRTASIVMYAFRSNTELDPVFQSTGTLVTFGIPAESGWNVPPRASWKFQGHRIADFIRKFARLITTNESMKVIADDFDSKLCPSGLQTLHPIPSLRTVCHPVGSLIDLATTNGGVTIVARIFASSPSAAMIVSM